MPGRVLVVEDESILRSLLVTYLKRRACDVIEAATAEDALTVIDSVETQLTGCVVDASLPGMSGDELLDRLARRYPTATLVLMSGYPAADTGNGALGIHFLHKPFRPSELDALLKLD